MADKGYRSASFEEDLNEAHMTLIRPATKTEAPRSGQRFLRPFHQITESIFQTFKGQLDLERHGGRTKAGVDVSSNRYSPSPPSSGTTKPPNDQAQHAPSSHMTTKTLELTI